VVRRATRVLTLSILVLATMVSSCKNPADPQSPTTPTLGFTLRGIVSEAVGDGTATLGAVLVEITSGTSSGTSTTTDAMGQFSIGGLSGTFNVRFSRDGWVPTGITVTMDADQFINVTMDRDDDGPSPGPVYTLSGVVTRRQGDMDPIPGALVEVTDGDRAGDSATTDALGRYSLPGLSGEVTILITRDGYEDLEKTVELTEDTNLIITLITPPMVSMCLDLDDEEVHITNDDRVNELVLTDWTLWEDVDGFNFKFVEDIECRDPMMGLRVPPGGTVIITSGDDPEHDPPTYIAGWCEFVWDNDGDTARLVNPDTGVVAEAVGRFAACGG
jgi:hypothetical protein